MIRIIVAIILFILSATCLVVALYENTVNGKNEKIRSLYGIYIAFSGIFCGLLLAWLAFCI